MIFACALGGGFIFWVLGLLIRDAALGAIDEIAIHRALSIGFAVMLVGGGAMIGGALGILWQMAEV